MDRLRPGTALLSIADATYHGYRRRQSNSSLGKFASNRREYWEAQILGEADDTDTEALRFGRLFHTLLLEPDKRDRFVTPPRTYGDLYELLGEAPPEKLGRDPYDASKKASANAKAFQLWKATETRTIVDAADVSLVDGMVEAIRSHDVAGDLVFSDDPRILRERVLFWRDEETGEAMRCKLDQFSLPSLRPIVVDIKTIEGRRSDGNLGDDRWLEAHCWRYRYHRQAAVYLDAYRACFGVNAVFAFIFVEKRQKRPAVSVQFLEVDDPAVIDGRDGLSEDGKPLGYRQIIRELQRVRMSGDWRHDCERGVRPYHLPAWRMRQLERDEAAMPLMGVG